MNSCHSQFRIMGRWHKGEDFLLCFAMDEDDYTPTLTDALADYTVLDRELIDRVWIEQWLAQRWSYVRTIPLAEIRKKRHQFIQLDGATPSAEPISPALRPTDCFSLN